VTISIGAVLVFALLPLLLEPRGARTMQQALRRPASARVALMRLEQHYQFVWLGTATPAEQAVRGRVLALQAGVVLVGAVAGRAAHAAGRPTTTPIRYGTASRTRARAALDAHEDTNHAA
jgi:drug/metabolite transporter superfamily protein YnfA